MQDVFSKSITLQLSTLNRFLFSSSVKETKQIENEKSDSQHQERSKREMKEEKKIDNKNVESTMLDAL